MELWLLFGAALALGLGGIFSGGGDSGGGGGDAAEGPPATAEGDSGDNLLIGSPLIDDAIYGRAGSDTITGDVGNDYLDGGLGDDSIDGDEGNDTIAGALGSDTINGGDGADSILGFGGADVIDGGEGNDSIRGGDGPDSIAGGLDFDSIEGGLGADTLSGILADPEDFPDNSGDDNAADTLEGWGGADRIILGSGDQAWGEFALTEADGLGDTFVVGTWISGTEATVHDFDPLVDQIEYYRAGGEALTMTSVVVGDVETFQLRADGDIVLLIPLPVGEEVLITDINIFSAPPPPSL